MIRADLRDRVAIVTGASSGLGRHFCRVLAEAGAVVVAMARRTDRLEELAGSGRGVVAAPGDVTDRGDIDRVVEVAAEQGGPHILVNAAGFGDAVPALEHAPSEFRRTVDVNLSASFEMSVTCLERMIEGGDAAGGAIINIASIYGLQASWPVAQAAYCAAKGGVVNLTRQLGAEWAQHGVRVNAIAPGWFPSELTEDLQGDERSMQWLRRNTPMARMGRLEELDGALLLLASDAGSFITGQTIAVDGGWSVH